MLVLKLCQQFCADKIPVTPTNKLGDGADGEVFEVEEMPNKVIKFGILYERADQNLNQTYFKQISQVLSWLIATPTHTYAHVYEHKYLGTYTREVVWKKEQKYIMYYYIMEKLYKLSEDERKVFHSILSHEDRNIIKNYSSDKIREMLDGMSRGLDFDAERVIFFHDNFKKIPIMHHDIHVRNIMKDAFGNFKLIDFDRAQLELEMKDA